MSAQVIRLHADDPTVNPRTGARPAFYPARRARNGHHADCPYPKTDPAYCGICRSMRIAADRDEPPARHLRSLPTEETDHG
ncbi:hypothetical protein GCM10010112_94000 [Actinoplanes lobatus]|uniref:Uncharacterized protein n=1 Tax=Actinoplanes lobatus TaxID=113568 RepID=A0A7W7MGC2_9ACTN|nr:hypothetical protein [Actinoplanes lobatus]MBB4749163.1 hypothetical protein [Actinoplanes lobatus]GGN99855.1 hypothetical protein GCM10010112_94000 [Actinoplanes lobatus]GIE46440.1 hypothetical protein Alo02nite_93380 [Actinoplanes lobatus]